jgi:hypothetical protein
VITAQNVAAITFSVIKRKTVERLFLKERRRTIQNHKGISEDRCLIPPIL